MPLSSHDPAFPKRASDTRREVANHPRLLLPELNTVGWSRFTQPATGNLPPHEHGRSWEICYIVTGRVDWWVADQVYEVKRGDVFITRPNEWHGGLDAIMHPCELYWLQITLPASKPLPGLTLRQTRRLRADYLALPSRLFPGSDTLCEHFEQILAVHRPCDTRHNHAIMRSRASLHLLLLDILTRAQAHATSLATRHSRLTTRIASIVQWIDTHLHEPFSVEQLASQAALGVSQFRARFLEEVGQSPVEHIAARRIARAKHLLVSQPDTPITRIAHDLTYQSSQYFATVFKHHTGLTPREYRRRHSTTTPRSSS